jgi:lipoprotein-anchoring transpeptidase ErfK/SrfK
MLSHFALAAIVAWLFIAPSFAQHAPLNLEQATRLNARGHAKLRPASASALEAPAWGSVPSRFLESLFGGLPPLSPRSRIPLSAEDRSDTRVYSAIAPLADHAEEPPLDPKFLPQVVPYGGPEKAGTIIVDTPQRFLYLVLEGGRALRYGVGVGREGFTWSGVTYISAKREWPDWFPPEEMRARRPDLPPFMAGGPDNPLGARALYLGTTLFRIHGSNEPWTIGSAVSSGCIRMRNEDVIDLYRRVKIGAKVIVI